MPHAAAPELTTAHVLEALGKIMDPDLGKDIVTLNFVKDLKICGGNVAFTVELTTPACPVKDKLKADAERVVRTLPGVEKVEVTMTAQVTASRPVLGTKGTIPGVRNVLAVSSGKGGVGKSTVAVNLAAALHLTGAKVGVLDADIHGPNVALMLGVRGKPLAEGNRMLPFTAHGMQVMSMALLVAEDQPIIWRGPMLHSAIKQFLFDVAWRDLDYSVVDLPPGTGDAQLSLAQQAHVMGALIVTTPQDVSVLDVKKAIRMFQTVNVPLLGIVENMAWFTPPGSSERYEIFGRGGGQRLEQEFGVPLLGQIPIEIAIREGGDRGVPVTLSQPESQVARAFRELAGKMAARVSTMNAKLIVFPTHTTQRSDPEIPMTHDKTPSTPTTPLAKGSFTETTTMADVLRLNPNAQWTLRQFHIGGCHHCGFDANDSISKVASDHGIPVPMLVQALNN